MKSEKHNVRCSANVIPRAPVLNCLVQEVRLTFLIFSESEGVTEELEELNWLLLIGSDRDEHPFRVALVFASNLDEAGGNRVAQGRENCSTDLQWDSNSSTKTCSEQIHQEVESGIVVSLLQADTENASALQEWRKIDRPTEHCLAFS